MELVLVHSPLVGPTTWHWVAEMLTKAGHEVTSPDLRSAAASGRAGTFIAGAVAATPTDWARPVLVAHSGAGFFLPSIADLLDRAGYVFVDAGLPPCLGVSNAGADYLDELRSLAVDGDLPRWSTWWSEEVMEALLPNEVRRAQVEAEMSEIPLAFYESPVSVPSGWCEAGGSFLLLSEPYRQDAERARALGWTVTERLGGHLDIVNDPIAIADAIIDLARRQDPDERA